MSKSIKKLSLKQGDTIEDFYFDSTTGIKGYEYYDTEEVIVGKWTNGKPIYRKIVSSTTPSKDYESKTISLGDAKVDEFVNIRCTATNTSYSAFVSNTSIYDGSSISQAIVVWGRPDNVTTASVKNTVAVQVKASTWYSRPIKIIVEYTKTTDAPDSFEEESVELTSEHKTGETFNGKPVYETWRTFTVPNSNSAVKVGNVTDLNIDTMLEIYGMMNDKTHFISFPDVLASSGSFFGIMVRDFGTTGEYNVYVACAQATATFKNQPIHVRFKYTKK